MKKIIEEQQSKCDEEKTCIFCGLKRNEILAETAYFYIKFDKFPVSKGHLLIISKNHHRDYNNLSKKEKIDLIEAIELCNILNTRNDSDGYNIGINTGIAAGQTVMHFHCHIIPRYNGDVENPTGGVRGVIPNKQKY